MVWPGPNRERWGGCRAGKYAAVDCSIALIQSSFPVRSVLKNSTRTDNLQDSILNCNGQPKSGNGVAARSFPRQCGGPGEEFLTPCDQFRLASLSEFSPAPGQKYGLSVRRSAQWAPRYRQRLLLCV